MTEKLRATLREVSKWLNEEPNRPIDREAVAVLCAALVSPDMEQRAGFVMVPVAQVVHEKFKDSLGGQHERRKVVLFKEGLDLPDGTLLAAAHPIEALGKADSGEPR